MVDPATADLLRATAALVRHVQASPTEAKRTALLRQARAAAEARWLAAGCPDLPLAGGEVRPSRLPDRVVRPPGGDEDKDWTPTTVTVEVRSVRERAVLLGTDDAEGWAPRSLCWLPGTREVAEVAVGDLVEVDLPRWLVDEKDLDR